MSTQLTNPKQPELPERVLLLGALSAARIALRMLTNTRATPDEANRMVFRLSPQEFLELDPGDVEGNWILKDNGQTPRSYEYDVKNSWVSHNESFGRQWYKAAHWVM